MAASSKLRWEEETADTSACGTIGVYYLNFADQYKCSCRYDPIRKRIPRLDVIATNFTHTRTENIVDVR